MDAVSCSLIWCLAVSSSVLQSHLVSCSLISCLAVCWEWICCRTRRMLTYVYVLTNIHLIMMTKKTGHTRDAQTKLSHICMAHICMYFMFVTYVCIFLRYVKFVHVWCDVYAFHKCVCICKHIIGMYVFHICVWDGYGQ